jgi:two-component system phosphate regulon sensor histidine kinase PhoR
MGISLAGIILVQFFWIRNAIQVKSGLFDQNVNRALSQTTERLEQNENVKFIQKKIGNDTISSVIITNKDDSNIVIHNGSQKVEYLNRDSLYTSFLISSVAAKPGKDSIQSSYMISVQEDEDAKIGFSITADQLKWHNDGDFVILGEEDDSTRIEIRKRLKKLDEKVATKELYIEQMVIEIDAYTKPIEERLGQESLEMELKQALENNGISIPYEYGVVSSDGDSISKVASPGYATDWENHELYSTLLFPGDVFERNEYLEVFFPGRSRFLLKSMFLLLFGSTLFTGIILVLFGSTLFIIIRQKKNSEIKSDFINNMTHEFKTPIATISLAVDAMENPKVVSDKEQLKYYSNIIREENRRMNAQVENVLRISLLDKNELELDLRTLDLNTIVRKAITTFSLLVEERKGELRADLSATVTTARVDEVHFMNVVINLLDNALKYSSGEPDIEIRTENSDHSIRISVSDKGIGMSKDTQRKIFEKFYRLEHGNVHNTRGFGLGLNYSKAMIEKFGGSISVNSELGKGSIFTIVIPTATET